MKPKYQGIVSIGLVLLAIGLAGGYSLMAGRMEKPRQHVPRQSQVPKISMPSEQDVQRMQQLIPALPRLAVPGVKPVAGSPLTLFGFRDGEVPGDAAQADGTDPLQMDYRLSLTLLSGNQHYCIIDGNFMAEGTVLEDGAQILKVENQRVLIRKQGDEKWVYIGDAGQPAEFSQSNASKEKGPS